MGERNNKQIDTQILANLIHMMSELNLYDSYFEYSFLKQTDSVYEKEAKNLAKSLSITDYLDHVNIRMLEEEKRVTQYLQSSTKKKIKQILVKHFLINNLKPILKTGFK